MSAITIRRCPYNMQIRVHAEGIKNALKRDYGRSASIQDGEEDEFILLLDGMPMLQRMDVYLPSIEEIESAILNSDEARSRHVTH